MNGYSIKDLEDWDSRIRSAAEGFGLDCYPQEFEICDHNQMLGYMTYSGLPSHYQHWSFGKAYEQLKTKYDYGVSGLPYEMVINTNPSLAYLMRDNSLLVQLMTIAHVYGHNDFFKNNFTFKTTCPETVLGTFKVHATRIRDYIENPGISLDKVEAALDAAHAVSFQRRRNLSVPKATRMQQQEKLRDQLLEKQKQREDRSDSKQDEADEQNYRDAIAKVPIEPDEDLLLFIRDNNRHLESWEKDILTIVDEEAGYFIPQIDTKIMNEGWASYWHKRILESLDLPQAMRMEFIVRHAQVLQPIVGGLNPYTIGFKIWDSLRIWFDGSIDPGLLREDERDFFERMKLDFEDRETVPVGTGSKTGSEAIFRIREVDRDTSFLRQFLTPVLMQELNLVQHELKNRDGSEMRVVTSVSDQDNWKQIKAVLIRSVGMGSFPVIKVEDANHQNNRTLLLEHQHDGRDLELESAKKTLEYVHELWDNPVTLVTQINGESRELNIDGGGRFTHTPHR